MPINILVYATSTSVIATRIETFLETFNSEQELQHIHYTQYSIQISQWPVQAFIDLGSKVNAMHPDFAKKFGF